MVWMMQLVELMGMKLDLDLVTLRELTIQLGGWMEALLQVVDYLVRLERPSWRKIWHECPRLPQTSHLGYVPPYNKTDRGDERTSWYAD
mmetsp:Transcript_25383/g.45060  ORF Transcript_25383/g.45060 Transcript_25383/m.45060 type:complete len:89 (-) Transcript_25383:303-569(-)